jgi:hypothetical protein
MVRTDGNSPLPSLPPLRRSRHSAAIQLFFLGLCVHVALRAFLKERKLEPLNGQAGREAPALRLLSGTRLENFQRHTEPFRRGDALAESAHLNRRLFHQRFVHPGDAEANGRIGEKGGLHRFGYAAAKFRDVENVPHFQPNMRQSAEISITVKRHLLDKLLRTDHVDELIRKRIIEQSARVPGEQSPFRIIARVGKCLQKITQGLFVHGQSILCYVLGGAPRSFHASEAEVIGTGVDLAFAARADDVTRTVLVVAKKRPASMHALLLVRLCWIEW